MLPTTACNVKLRKLLSALKSHVRETSLFTGAIPNQVRNSQTSRFVSVPRQNPGRSIRGDSVGLRTVGVDFWGSLGAPQYLRFVHVFISFYHILPLAYIWVCDTNIFDTSI